MLRTLPATSINGSSLSDDSKSVFPDAEAAAAAADDFRNKPVDTFAFLSTTFLPPPPLSFSALPPTLTLADAADLAPPPPECTDVVDESVSAAVFSEHFRVFLLRVVLPAVSSKLLVDCVELSDSWRFRLLVALGVLPPATLTAAFPVAPLVAIISIVLLTFDMFPICTVAFFGLALQRTGEFVGLSLAKITGLWRGVVFIDFTASAEPVVAVVVDKSGLFSFELDRVRIELFDTTTFLSDDTDGLVELAADLSIVSDGISISNCSSRLFGVFFAAGGSDFFPPASFT